MHLWVQVIVCCYFFTAGEWKMLLDHVWWWGNSATLHNTVKATPAYPSATILIPLCQSDVAPCLLDFFCDKKKLVSIQNVTIGSDGGLDSLKINFVEHLTCWDQHQSAPHKKRLGSICQTRTRSRWHAQHCLVLSMVDSSLLLKLHRLK